MGKPFRLSSISFKSDTTYAENLAHGLMPRDTSTIAQLKAKDPASLSPTEMAALAMAYNDASRSAKKHDRSKPSKR